MFHNHGLWNLPPVLGSEKKYMDSGPGIHGAIVGRRGSKHLFVPTLCTISENTNDEDGHLLANGTSNTVGHVVFHGKKQQKIRQFQLTFGGCCLLSSVCPISVWIWSVRASDPTKNRTTSKCTLESLCEKSHRAPAVMPLSLLALEVRKNQAESRCPSRAAVNRGVAPSSVRPWSLSAPDSTRNRTISRCPISAATIWGVAPV